jgi:hypothetical protein
MSSIKHNGFRLQVFTNDHRPPHVHVFSPNGWEFRFALGKKRLGKLLSVRGRGRQTEAKDAAEAAAVHYDTLLEIWTAHHGKP